MGFFFLSVGIFLNAVRTMDLYNVIFDLATCFRLKFRASINSKTLYVLTVFISSIILYVKLYSSTSN